MKGISRFLVEKGYLSKQKEVEVFNNDVLHAILHVQRDYGLPETGMVDDDTLTCLIWGMTSAELDIADPCSIAAVVWIPTDGGIRLHKKEECCQMIAPRMLTVRNGWALGIEPCGICNRKLRQQLIP